MQQLGTRRFYDDVDSTSQQRRVPSANKPALEEPVLYNGIIPTHSRIPSHYRSIPWWRHT